MLSCSPSARLSMKSILIRKDDEVQVVCRLLLRSYATNTTCALQGRRGAGQLLPSPSELRHKYDMCSILIRKDAGRLQSVLHPYLQER